MRLRPARTLSVSIDRSPADVYAYVRDGTKLPEWSFFRTATRDGDGYRLETPEGVVRLRFCADNPHGVLDHDVTLPNGQVVHVPLRVIANGEGSEVVLTVFRAPGVTDAAFADDAAQVVRDLSRLKQVLELS